MRTLPLLILLGLAPAFAAANDCRYTAQHDFDVDAAGLKTVAFALDSSDVEVEGVPGLAKVEVRGKACASDQERLARLGVDQQRSGDRLTVTPKRDEHAGSWGGNYAYIDLKVRVPATFALDIDGSSGDADVRNVAALNFASSSGDLQVDRIAGPLVIKVSSGDVKGGDVGSVDVRSTSSGDIRLRGVKGDVHVASAGSGDLRFDDVGGGVRIGDVGSGDVTIDHVQRDVSLDSIGSGDVNVSDVGGNFTVRSQGSGDVNHHGVRGTVSVPKDRD